MKNYMKNYKNVKNIDDGVKFEKSEYVERALGSLIGLLTCNSPKITFHPLFKNHELFSDPEIIKEFVDMVIGWVDEVLPKLLVFGFIFYTKKSGHVIQFLDFRNGNIKYNVKNNLVELLWIWVNKNKFGKTPLFEEVDKNVKCYVHRPPTFNGELTGKVSNFIKIYRTLQLLEQYAVEIEENKVNRKFFLQKILPELKPDQYEVFQNHTFLVNANLNEVDDPRKRFYNMQGVNRHIEYFEKDWKKRTEELITKFFNVRKFQEFSKDKKSGLFTAGELVKVIFPDVINYGELLSQKRIELKDMLSEVFGIFQYSSQKQLKDQVRLSGFSIRTSINKIGRLVAKCLTDVLSNSLEDVMDYAAKKKIEELKLQNKQIPDKKNKIEIPDLNILKLINVELDPIQYLTDGEQEMFSDYNLSLGDRIRISFGSGLLDYIPNADNMYQFKKKEVESSK